MRSTLPYPPSRRYSPQAEALLYLLLEHDTKTLKHDGANSRDYPCVCARRGCFSTATEAKVPEAVLWLQSGNAQTRSSRAYIKLAKPDLLFATWAAFNL